MAVLIAHGEDERLELDGEIVVAGGQVVFLYAVLVAQADHVVFLEEHAVVFALVHVLTRIKKGELIVAGFACVGAELRAVAAFVAHLVDMDDLVRAVGHLDDHVRAVRAGIDAVFTHGGAL